MDTETATALLSTVTIASLRTRETRNGADAVRDYLAAMAS